MKIHGFTLFELIITIALAAILLGLAVPNLRNFIQDNRITAQTNELVTALNLARSEALKRGGNVALCASSNGSSCAGSWQGGWIVARNPSSPDVIREFDRPSAGANVTSLPANTTTITFAGSGMLDGSVTLSTDIECRNAICFDLAIDGATRCRAGRNLGIRRVVVTRTGGIAVQDRPCGGN